MLIIEETKLKKQQSFIKKKNLNKHANENLSVFLSPRFFGRNFKVN